MKIRTGIWLNSLTFCFSGGVTSPADGTYVSDSFLEFDMCGKHPSLLNFTVNDASIVSMSIFGENSSLLFMKSAVGAEATDMVSIDFERGEKIAAVAVRTTERDVPVQVRFLIV